MNESEVRGPTTVLRWAFSIHPAKTGLSSPIRRYTTYLQPKRFRKSQRLQVRRNPGLHLTRLSKIHTREGQRYFAFSPILINATQLDAPFLYSVVFSENYTSYGIYDSKVNLVVDKVLLLNARGPEPIQFRGFREFQTASSVIA